MNTMRRFVVVLAGAGLFAGCQNMNSGHEGHSHSMMQNASKVAVAEIKPSRAATTRPSMNNVNGTVTFSETAGKVKVVANISGLTPNTTHGFHVHASGDMSAPDLMSTGGHYNPDNHAHGGPTTSPVHAGDLGNIKADASGKAMYEITVDNLSLGGPKNDVVGKAVIIHAAPDDLKSQPAGNAGARVAGGVIQLKQ